jgi:hypothetical protein
MTPRTIHYLLNPDPDTDPDAAYQVNPDPDPIRIQGFDDQKLKKKYSRKFILSFLLKSCNLLIPRPL